MLDGALDICRRSLSIWSQVSLYLRTGFADSCIFLYNFAEIFGIRKQKGDLVRLSITKG